VVNRILHLHNGYVNVYDGGYSYFAEKREEAVAQAAAASKPNRTTPAKEAYLAFKEASRERARIKKAIKSTRSEIAEAEKELAKLDAGIASDIPRTDWAALEAASTRKQQIENRLLELYDQLEHLEKHEDN
jgi:ATPase subunit of ABC transporter with duplicated ATPase domains